MASYVREDSVGRTRGLAEFLMDQLSSQPMFMDIDIIPGCGVRGVYRGVSIGKRNRSSKFSRNKRFLFQLPRADSELMVNVILDSIEMPQKCRAGFQNELSYTLGKRNAIWMLQHAMVQRHIHDADGTNVTLIVLWDRNEVDAKGSMADLVDLAQKNGIKVVHIDCSDWGKSKIVTEEANVNGADREFTSELELTHMPWMILKKQKRVWFVC